MSSSLRITTLKSIRGKDIKLRYTQDDFEDALVNQRTYFDDGATLLTPITSKLLERQVSPPDPALEKMGGGNPRHAICCFGSPLNQLGESHFKVIIPFCPGDDNLNLQIAELKGYNSPSHFLEPKKILAIKYHGENYRAKKK